MNNSHVSFVLTIAVLIHISWLLSLSYVSADDDSMTRLQVVGEDVEVRERNQQACYYAKNDIKNHEVCSSSSSSSSSSGDNHDVADVTSSHYTAYDDVSWAITHENLKYSYHQNLYNNFMKQCRTASPYCKSQENLRLYMNNNQPKSVYNYTAKGIKKTKVPALLWKILNDFYQKSKGQEVVEWDKKVNPYHNLWDAPTHILRLDNTTLGGGQSLQSLISRVVRPVLEEWTGQRLAPVSVYGIRKYLSGAVLTPHVDRLPLVTSCIINIDQDVDEDWPLEIYDHEGLAHNITMQPGDMVLYESHSIIHGRPFPLVGRFYSNVFLHTEPVGSLDGSGEDNVDGHNVVAKLGPNENGMPPYIVGGSIWEKQWKEDNPDGWDLLNNPTKAVLSGDMRTLEMLAQVKPKALKEKDENGWAPIHIAVQNGRLDILKFLLENGASTNDKTGLPGGDKKNERIPLELAVHLLGYDHQVTKYLWEVTNF